MEAKKKIPRRQGLAETEDITRARKQCQGKQSGCRLDTQLHQTIQLAQKLCLSPCVFINSLKRRIASKALTKRESLHLERIVSKLTLPALNFWRMCAIKHYTPQYSQVTVGSIDARLATKVDVKCIDDKTKGVVLIENKVGYNSFHHSSTGNMNAPYSTINNCTYNQHQIQLAMTTELHKQTFKNQNIVQSIVWKYDATGVSEFPLENWARDGAKEVLKLVINSK
jgi:hypothetical protein